MGRKDTYNVALSLRVPYTREEFDKGLTGWSFPWKDMFVAKLHFSFFSRRERPWENNWEEVML